MNYEELKYAKMDFEEMCKIFDLLEEKGLIDNPSESLKLRDVFQYDIARFLLYLSASDGKIDANEVTVYQIVTGYSDDAKKIVKYLKENNIYSTEFESTVPISLKMAIDAEYKMLQITGKTRDKTLPELVTGVFERIGRTLIQADGGVSYTERRDYDIYMNTLRGYMQERGF